MLELFHWFVFSPISPYPDMFCQACSKCWFHFPMLRNLNDFSLLLLWNSHSQLWLSETGMARPLLASLTSSSFICHVLSRLVSFCFANAEGLSQLGAFSCIPSIWGALPQALLWLSHPLVSAEILPCNRVWLHLWCLKLCSSGQASERAPLAQGQVRSSNHVCRDPCTETSPLTTRINKATCSSLCSSHLNWLGYLPCSLQKAPLCE